MGIQYVTVKVDTSGLYQPLASATGVVGMVGPAPSAGPGFSNPTLFTRPLTGAGGEPYARIVPVLMVAPLASDVWTLSIAGNPAGGTFTLSFAGQTTAAIPFNATSAQVQTALQALTTIGPGNVACAGGPLPSASVTITFAGTLGFQPLSAISVGNGSLTGGTNPTATLAHTVTGSARVNDVQTLSIGGSPTGGSFTLSFGGQTTAAIPFNATSAQVQTALQALASIGAGNVACGGGPLPAGVTITFQATLGLQPQAPITVGANNLTGPAPAVAHTTTGSGANDLQTLSISGNPTGGTFTLAFGGQTTAAIPFNATAAQVQAALVALSSVGAGNVLCAGGALPGAAVTVTFQGTLGSAAQAVITVARQQPDRRHQPRPCGRPHDDRLRRQRRSDAVGWRDPGWRHFCVVVRRADHDCNFVQRHGGAGTERAAGALQHRYRQRGLLRRTASRQPDDHVRRRAGRACSGRDRHCRQQPDRPRAPDRAYHDRRRDKFDNGSR